MSAQFTPGPWSTNVSRLSDGSILVVHIIAENGSSVAQLSTYGEGRTLANASMAAAAPELYEACESNRLALIAIADSAVEAGFDKLADIIDAELAKANTALAKARGEQVPA